jgi:hypothetical protein
MEKNFNSSLLIVSCCETAHNNIMAYALLKIQLHAKRLYSEVSLSPSPSLPPSLSLSLSHTHTHTRSYYNLFSRVLMDVELSMFFMMQILSVAAGVSSFCFPGCKVPAWFVQQNSAASVTIQLPSDRASSELLSFMHCCCI